MSKEDFLNISLLNEILNYLNQNYWFYNVSFSNFYTKKFINIINIILLIAIYKSFFLFNEHFMRLFLYSTNDISPD